MTPGQIWFFTFIGLSLLAGPIGGLIGTALNAWRQARAIETVGRRR